VLLNLVIARMSSTFEQVSERSHQELQYNKAVLVEQYSLIEERSPFCILPAPFNLLPVLFSVFDLYVQYSRSNDDFTPCRCYAATVANFTVGFVMSFIAPWFEFLRYVMRLILEQNVWKHFAEVVYFIVIWPVHYLIYVIVLLHESFCMISMVKLRASDTDSLEMKYMVDFNRELAKRSPPRRSKHTEDKLGPWINIRVIRCNKLELANHYSNPIVKVQFGSMELCTGTSLHGGADPVYMNQVRVLKPH
jgi:hypothetical protein